MVSVSITRERIDGWTFDVPHSPEEGADLVLTELVRDSEKGGKISALVYEHYEGMVAIEKFGITGLHCIRRIGPIPVGEAVIVVLVRSKHRNEAFSAMSRFMDELKKSVPIWKVRCLK